MVKYAIKYIIYCKNTSSPVLQLRPHFMHSIKLIFFDFLILWSLLLIFWLLSSCMCIYFYIVKCKIKPQLNTGRVCEILLPNVFVKPIFGKIIQNIYENYTKLLMRSVWKKAILYVIILHRKLYRYAEAHIYWYRPQWWSIKKKRDVY